MFSLRKFIAYFKDLFADIQICEMRDEGGKV